MGDSAIPLEQKARKSANAPIPAILEFLKRCHFGFRGQEDLEKFLVGDSGFRTKFSVKLWLLWVCTLHIKLLLNTGKECQDDLAARP